MGVDKQPPEGNAALFAQYYDEIKRLVLQRRSKWNLSTLEWADVESMLITHVWKKMHLYDSTRPFDHWCNTVLTAQITNILRDNLWRAARPCIASSCYGTSCVYNLGDGLCGWTPTGHQDESCPLYAAWKAKKGTQADISSPLSLESHTDEHHNTPSDFVDIETHKAALDKIMLKKLSKGDAKLYRLIYIRHLPMEKVIKMMGLKVSPLNRTPLTVTKARNRFIKMAKVILAELDIT